MIGEKVAVKLPGNEEITIPIEEITLPDADVIGLFLHCLGDAARLEHVIRTAEDLVEKILRRDPMDCVNCPINIQVPSLSMLGTAYLPREEKEIVIGLWLMLHALIRHIIPDPKISKYINGHCYSGECWITVK
jgi:hypothetical protein